MLDKEKASKKIDQVKQTVSVSWRMLKLVWKTDRLLFIGTTIAVLVPAVVPFLNAYIAKLVIDRVVEIVGGAPFVPADFYPLLFFSIATYFLQDVAFRTQGFMERLLWTKVPIYLNQLVFEKLSTLDMQYFENDKFRNLIEKVRESIGHRPQNLVDNILFAAQSLLRLIIAFIALANLNWFFILLVSLVAIPEFINQTAQSKLSWGIWSDNSAFRKRFGYLNHLLFHHREVKEIKIFRLAKKFIDEAKSIQNKFYNDNKKLAQKSLYYGLIFNGLSTAVFIGIQIYVIFEALAKRVTVGDINFYGQVISNFQNGLGGLLRNLNGVFESNLYIQSIFDLLDSEPIVKPPQKPLKLNTQKALTIEFKNVTFTYPESKAKILNNFSLLINPGDKIAFVGENGAGKSTIIKLLVRFYDVNEGEILINGINIKDLDIDDLYQHIGVLFQDFNNYEDPVRDNIYFGDIHREENLDEIIKASISAGAHPMIQKLDKGYKQMLGKTFEGGIELSGGQWQKIALSRAFFRNAPVLVLDEPTAAIDAKAEAEIFGRVEKLSKDKTVIIISHRFSTVRNADKIYVIDNGKIVESGSHEQLMKEDGQYASLFKLQARGYQ